ncbi:uncharacterized protein LOC114411255 [Glycine soja]|uniref:uncharacterized protein LOC114411255 n=1 Tax=Glycine soja TaxID=3848 RepID=UPI00103C0217|nr:uncharacterized protein LOC114411255 [Glycine soja]
MSEIEELQEQMKANMETMKEQMTTMMEAMMDMRKIMEVNVVVAVATSTATKGDPTHLPIFNQESHLVTNVEGQGGATVVVAYGPQEEAREALVDHTVTGFRPHPGYITEGHAFSGVLVLSAPRASQYRLLSQPLHFVGGEGPSAIFEKEKIKHIEERLHAIEGGGSYGFVNMSELCLVPNVTIPLEFKVPNFDKYKRIACPKNHLRMYCRRMWAYAMDEKLLMHFFQESLAGAAII